jgi:hypothetical protein
MRNESKLEWVVAAMGCALAVWVGVAHINRSPYDTFEMNAAFFEGFIPKSDVWSIKLVPLNSDPMEPNIIVMQFSPLSEADGVGTGGVTRAASVRLVHGYNMCDCMRIKGFRVDLIEDRRLPEGVGVVPGSGTVHPDIRVESRDKSPVQIWRLTSKSGERAVWVTSMIRATDFAQTVKDVRSMAFPKIGMPDDPGWVPQGLTVESVKHPIREFRWRVRARWNNSRCDWLTFLGLRRPVWADPAYLTVVVASRGGDVTAELESAVTAQLVAAHDMFCAELRAWARRGRRQAGANE